MNRVIHFDIYADDPERATKFYTDVFGWKFEKWSGPMDYWLITTGPDGQAGINGGMAKREGQWAKMQSSMGAITIGVDNLDETLLKLEKAGAEIVMKKAPIPEVGWFANFKDPEGNVLGLMQEDPSAK